MAKGSQFWGTASGKLGQQVLYRAGGEQRARTYVQTVRNPKTLQQMVNRISMRNFSVIYNALKPVLLYSFSNKKSNQSAYNAFVSANKSSKSPVVPKIAADMGLSAPVNMLVSKGDITEPTFSIVNAGQSSAAWVLNATAPSSMSSTNFVTEIANALGLPSNTKMTIIRATYEDEGYSLTYDTFEGGVVNAKYQEYGFGSADGKFKLGPESAEEMRAVIFSYSDGDGKLRVSTARLQTLSEDKSFESQFLPEGEIYTQVLDDYGYNQDNVLATK